MSSLGENRPVNVLIVSDLWQPFPGGAERLVFNIARVLDAHPGIAVQVLTGYELARQFDGPPISIESIGIRDDHDDGAAILRRYLHEMPFRPDVVIAHHLYAYEFADELTGSGIPVVQIVLNTRRLPGAAFAVFISDYIADAVGKADGDMTMIPPAFPDVVARTEVPPFDRRAVGFIKPIPHKGVELVYKVAARLPGRQFLVLRGEWQDLEVVSGLANVEYMDPVDDISTFYDQCRLVLMPSVSEDAGTVAQEAALNGIPCISSKVGGLRQTNAGGVRLVSRDPRDWVAAIERFDDRDWYDSVAARQRAVLDATGRDVLMGQFRDRILGLVGQPTGFSKNF